MPFFLRESESLPEVAGLRSLLIVPCRFCPAASLAVRMKEPYLEPFRRLLRTRAYEAFIKSLEGRLQNKGVRTAVFDSKLLHQFVACMWTSKRRRQLAERAREFDGVLVLGCDAMVETVRASLGTAGCRVIQGMEIEGLMNVLPALSLPLNVSLELQNITPLGKESQQELRMRADPAGHPAGAHRSGSNGRQAHDAERSIHRRRDENERHVPHR